MINRAVVFSLIMLFLAACGGSDDGSSGDDDPLDGASPKAATLIFPEENKECTEGIVVNDTQSTILFEWNAAEDADRYEVVIQNLIADNFIRMQSNENQIEVTLLRNTPYEWYVISISNNSEEIANSARWKFYNQGDGVTNYAPFPAQVVAPTNGQTLSAVDDVTLQWNGSDVDNNIENYEVLFGTNSNPTAVLGTTANSTLVTGVNAGGIYYWRVISKDALGSTSQSEIFSFRVQ